MIAARFPAALLALAVTAGSETAPASAQTLSNGLVTARFGPSGLTTLADGSGDAPYGFARDAFSVTVDGTRYGFPAAPSRKIAESQRVTFTWPAGPHAIQVTYELKPGWRFISKQITIEPGTRDRFRVDEVVVFDATLTTHVAEAYIAPMERNDLGLGSYAAALRFPDGRGLLALAQNPFLEIARDRNSVSVSYRPAMEWTRADGPFVADRGILAPYQRSGVLLPARMQPEWRFGPAASTPGMDQAEVAAFTAIVRAFMLYEPREPLNIFVGWCVNDYQIDIATEAGRAEYRRVIDRAADLGAAHVLFAPTNSSLARRDDSTDDWKWENLLWLGLGQKIRRNEWNPAADAVPPSVQEMLDHAKSRRVSLVAYVYPVLAFSQNPEWLVTRPHAAAGARTYASLGFRSLQDWLIETLVAFRKKTGISGYAFDHTFLNFDGPSRYAQWAGWRRVMETLRARMPDIVIDGRQAYHLYGPWSWLAGSYPHPTYNDEQPESFTPFPDLSVDRVSANRERYTAYRYRNYDFAPGELVPGFITHQTPRSDETGDMPQHQSDRGIVLEPFRVRDWDSVGWRYSLLSSIAVGGWNNVINMIPARDLEEYRHFAPEDVRWFRSWLEWARLNRDVLRHTRTILGEPGIGRIDGTAAIVDGHGYIFLFNPNARALRAEVPLDERIGLSGGGSYHVEEVHPVPRRLGRPGRGLWSHGEAMSVRMDGHSALVLSVQAVAGPVLEPLLFGVPGSVSFAGGVVSLTDVRGEPGTSGQITVLLPGRPKVTGLRINGREFPVSSPSPGVFETRVTFDGVPFGRAEPIGDYDPAFAGGTLTARFSVPRRVFDQLAARRKAWPISYTADQLRATWLAPHRLLLYVQIAEPDDRWEPRLTIDGQAVELERAYSAVRAVRETFVGFYADVSALAPDRQHTLELQLPALKPGQFQGVFFENVEPEYTAILGGK
ncbi:MAG: hypothetical protein HYU53_09880 [Acidobacteria bacterium]|nr:hypothetical protein [Acidobacteriota bacterium]